MSRYAVVKSAVPEGPYATHLACIPTEAVPYILGGLVLRSQKYWYLSADDWHRGRKLLALSGASMLVDCTERIVNAIDRVYTLLDAGLNGRGRDATGEGTPDDPFVYLPPLEQAIDPADFLPGGLRSDANVTRYLLGNLVNGEVSPVATDPRNIRTQLEDILAAIVAIEGEDGPTAAQVAQIIALLG